MKRRSVPYAPALALSAASLGCITYDASYVEMRRMTAERLAQEVRWFARDTSDREAAEATNALLAQPLTVDGAVQVALFNNPGLQAAFEELGVASGRLRHALRLPNPTFDAALRLERGGSREPDLELGALIDLSELLLMPVRRGAALAALDAARTSAAGRVLDVAFATRVAFYDVIAAEQALELQRGIVAALQAAYVRAVPLHAAGTLSDLSFANERALYEEARIAESEAEANLLARRETLNARMGLWGPRAAQWTTGERLPDPPREPPDLAGLEQRALERSLDLLLCRERFDAAARIASLRRVEGWTPALRAGVSAERESGQAWALGPALSLELPLAYQGQGETAAALAEMRREQQLSAEIANRIRAKSRAAAARLAAATRSATYYREVLVPLRQHIVEETRRQFEARRVSEFQLLQARRDQIEAGRAYVEALRTYWTLRAEVDQLAAGRLPVTEPSPESHSRRSSDE